MMRHTADTVCREVVEIASQRAVHRSEREQSSDIRQRDIVLEIQREKGLDMKKAGV